MAKYEDYAKRLRQEGNDPLSAERNDAKDQEQNRPRDPETGQFASGGTSVDWEQRYKELEKLNSRQAQDLGNYRKLVDDYLTNPTPANNAASVKEDRKPITADDLYDNPEEAVLRAVDSHPAVKEVQELRRELAAERQAKELSSFKERHNDFEQIVADPGFKNWVFDNPTRTALAAQADRGDLTAADALFSLYKAEKGFSQSQSRERQGREIANASLESGRGAEPPAPERYSRREMLEKKIRAKQGDAVAERYVNSHAEAYRKALISGNVRD